VLLQLFTEHGRLLLEALAGCFFLGATWAARRTQRWLLALLDRERLAFERHIESARSSEVRRHNETLKILSQASASTERPTLQSLLVDEKTDFVLESSVTPYEPVQFDWSDDNEPTTHRETPDAKKQPSNPP
jgi:hypothetical protein